MRRKDIPKFGLLGFQGLKYRVWRKMFFPPISALKYVTFKKLVFMLEFPFNNNQLQYKLGIYI